MSQNSIISALKNQQSVDSIPNLPAIETIGSLPALLRSYNKILGWSFRFIPQKKNIQKAYKQNSQNDYQHSSTFSNDIEYINSIISSQPELSLKSSKQKESILSEKEKNTSNLNIVDLFPSDDFAQRALSRFETNTIESNSLDPHFIPVEIKLEDGTSCQVGIIEFKPKEKAWATLNKLAHQAASAIADIVGELLSTRYALWSREAQLASKSALLAQDFTVDNREIASLLQEILKNATEGLACNASAMYMLDDRTSELKMRSCWGLPAERLQDPARPLSSASADLEAMIGHAVILEGEENIYKWNSPEDFLSSLCVPLLSQSNILGTVWFFSSKERHFSERQVLMAELVAGRLATELERAALMDNYSLSKNVKQEFKTAVQMQKNQLPVSSPWIENWDMGGKTRQRNDFGGNFYDWFTLSNGNIVCAMGDSSNQGLPAALTASSVKSAIRAHGQYQLTANQLLTQVDHTIWSSSAADQEFNLFCAVLNTNSNEVEYSTAGNQKIYLVREDGIEELSQSCSALGSSPQNDFVSNSVALKENEALVVMSSKLGEEENVIPDTLENVRLNLDRNAKFCVREMFGWLEFQNLLQTDSDYTLLVIKSK